MQREFSQRATWNKRLGIFGAETGSEGVNPALALVTGK